MKRSLIMCGLVLPLLALLTSPLTADVKTRDKTQFKLEGMLGRVIGMFGGKAARDGIIATSAVKGDRKASLMENSGQIVDLKEEKIYEVDYKKKEYRVTTFEEMRRRIKEQQENAREQAEETGERDPQQPQKEWEFDFDAKETGQKKQLAGYDTRQVIMTVTVREKGKALEDGGGFVMTSDTWLGPEIPALKEFSDFEMRYFKKLYGEEAFGTAMEQLAVVMAMFPALGKASERMKQEGDKLKGTALAMTTTFESVKSKAQMAQPEEGSGGGRPSLGGFARKIMKKDPPKQRSLVFTLNHEFQEVSTSVAATDLELPACFKEKK